MFRSKKNDSIIKGIEDRLSAPSRSPEIRDIVSKTDMPVAAIHPNDVIFVDGMLKLWLTPSLLKLPEMLS